MMLSNVRFIIALCIFSGIFCLCMGCSDSEPMVSVNAEVLGINEYILAGQLIGAFLGSPSGSFSNDVIKVSVRFVFEDRLILTDLELNHAELLHYKDVQYIPLKIQLAYWGSRYGNYLLFLNSRCVCELKLL